MFCFLSLLFPTNSIVQIVLGFLTVYYKTAPSEERRKEFLGLRHITGFCILEVLGRKNVLIRRNDNFEIHWQIISSCPSDVYIDEYVIDKDEVTFSWKK